MAQFETWVDTDLAKPVKVVHLGGNLFSQDCMSNLIGVNVFNNGQAASLSGTVTGYVVRADGQTVLVSGSSYVGLTGNKATIKLPQSAYYVPGVVSIVIKLTTGSVITTLAAVTGVIYRTSTDAIVDPGHVIPSLEELLDHISEMEAATAAALAAIDSIDDLSASATGLAAGASPTATITTVSGHKNIALGIPKGDKGDTGPQGPQGPKGDPGNADVIADDFSTSKAYSAGDYVLYSGSLYVFTSAHAAGAWNASHVSAVKLANETSALKSAITYGGLLLSQSNLEQGSYNSAGATTSSDTRVRTKGFIPVEKGGVIRFVPGTITSNIFYGKFNSNKSFIADGPAWGDSDISIDWDGYVILVFKNGTNTAFAPADYDATTVIMTASEAKNSHTKTVMEGLIKQSENIAWITGYYFNKNSGEISAESGYKYCAVDVSELVGGRVEGATSCAPNSQIGIGFTDENNSFITGYASTNSGQWLFTYDVAIPQNAKYFYISCRIATESMFSYPIFSFDYAIQNISNSIAKIEGNYAENVVQLENAKHISGGNSTPLVLMHFSDLHGQAQTMRRLVDKMASIGDVDGIICTGDMVRYKAESISSWWDANVMTCIGNHDSASYNDGTYNWTALSMADRDAYYITPFKSNWGITHTSGTSYYYKDYSTQKVRLIVMDAMLYNDNGAEATAQTAWLENLLADAISNNLHVLIAIHAPHGGSTAEDCSFSRYGQGTMPTLSDCNTPQTVIDAVATKITAGLKFIGYLCGHTHQDNIWDAENDGKQLMYCVTCASAEEVQWVNSDQHRGFTLDAFNIVTVDTEHTLLKIVRGGGANIDDHMRTRKAICFNYSTGEKVGEVL